MKFLEIRNKFEELSYINMGDIKDIDINKMLFRELNNLKSEIMSSYFVFDTIEGYTEMETLKLKIVEEMLLCSINIREHKGLPLQDSLVELENFYRKCDSKYIS